MRHERESQCCAFRVQYSTWAGMIVAQYGRIPGDRSKLAAAALSFASDDAPRQSAALDRLQQYYGTGDTSSEPPDFRPGLSTSSSLMLE